MSLKLGTTDIPSLSPGAIRLGANSLDRVYDGTKLIWERGFKYTDPFNNLTSFTQTSTGSGVGVTTGSARWAGGTDGSAILLYNSLALTTNQYIGATMSTMSNLGSVIIFHCDSGFTGYYGVGVNNSRISLLRTSGRWSQNTATTYAQFDTTISVGTIIEAWNINNIFYVAVNGTVVITYTMSSPIIGPTRLYQGFGMFRATFANSSNMDVWNGGDAGAWGKI
ncbi:hypothetical protein EON76_00700 [bacterium]|nr:MAG: hypothetical protein EON76_00700 [bacterium]